jgi:EpsI family protein
MSIVVPILANGLRAYMIVMIGHTSNMELATGVDHLIYGWIFFGIVMFIMFWVGSYWRQDTDAEAAAMPRADASAVAAPGRLRNMALAVLAACAVWPAFVAWNAQATFNPRPASVPPVAVSWPVAPGFSTWVPHYATPDTGFNGVYRQDGLAPVALTILYYRNQTRDKALISSLNRMAGEKDAYHENGATLRSEQLDARSLGLVESRMQGPGGTFLVWHWNALGGTTFTNAYAGKLLQARTRLLFGADDGAAIMLSAPYTDNRPDEARAALRAFLDAHLKAIESSLASARSN